MSDLIFEAAAMSTSALRERLALARNTARRADATVKDREHAVRERLRNEVGGDAKSIGSNEQIREDRYRSEYGRDPEWVKARATWLDAQDAIEILEAVLNGRLDQITERRLVADEQRTVTIGRAVEAGVGALA